MNKIANVANQVKQVLTDNPETRNNDYKLWIKVIELDVDKKPLLFSDFRYIVGNLRALGIPNFETVSRARRKVQEQYPELRATEKTRKFRAEKEEEFKEFAKNG